MAMLDVAGAELLLGWLEHQVTGNPRFRAAFVRWARAQDADRWRRWAALRGMADDDDGLAHDAVLVVQELVAERVRHEMDRLAATIEARELLENDLGLAP